MSKKTSGANKEYQKAFNKAIKIADLLGIQTTTQNEDGSQTVRKPKPVKNNTVEIGDLIKVIME